MVESYGRIIADSVKSQLPNSSYDSSQQRAWFTSESNIERSCVIASKLGHEYECGERSRLLVVLRWFSTVFNKILNAYLASPILMVCIPMLFGIGVGICLATSLGWSKEKNSFDGVSKNRGRVLSFILSLTCTIHWFFEVLISEFALDNFQSDGTDDELQMVDDSKASDGQCSEIEDEDERDNKTRKYLKSDIHTQRESGVDLSRVPKHIAVIMDGNRRYGKLKYGSATRGHWDGSKTLLDFSKWCLAEGVEIVTVYAFSTENWNRSAAEVSALMQIFLKYCDELRVEALERGICLKVLSTETDQIPNDVATGIQKMVEETKHCKNLTMNICLSYGGRGEILNACKAIADDVNDGIMNPSEITESTFESKLLTDTCPSPDLIIRTSGEYRLSNFLLWQLAYSEMFFLDKQWPELTKTDLISVIRQYANNRKRRFGK